VTTWPDPSTQIGVPVLACNPLIARNEVPLVVIATFPVLGVNETGPVVVSILLAPKVRLLLIVVVPEVAPKVTVVAAPPIFKVVAVVLNKVAIDLSVVISACEVPLTLMPLYAVTKSLRSEVPSIVNAPLAWITPRLEIDTPVPLYPPPVVREFVLTAAEPALIDVALGKLIVAPLRVSVPVVAPIVKLVAALASVTVEAFVSNKEADEPVVEIVPLSNVKVPCAETSPEDPVTEK
jgi:hypothetical protein